MNLLTIVPRGIAELHRLSRLNLSFNRIEVLPGWLFTMPSLKGLILSGNRIKELPCESDIVNAIRAT